MVGESSDEPRALLAFGTNEVEGGEEGGDLPVEVSFLVRSFSRDSWTGALLRMPDHGLQEERLLSGPQRSSERRRETRTGRVEG